MVRKSKALKEATDTDMTGGGAYQDIVAPPRKEGDPTGQTTAIENQIAAVSGTQPIDGGPPGAIPGPRPQPISLSSPTQRPSEPVTAGIPFGPGNNGPEPITTNTVDNFLMAAREVFPDPIFDQLLDS
mgnify:CR=1 FL=1